MTMKELYDRVMLIAMREFGTLQGVEISLSRNPESGTVTYCLTRECRRFAAP